MYRNEEDDLIRMQGLGIWIITLFVIILAVMQYTTTVYSREELTNREIGEFFREKEEHMIEEVREYLSHEGYKNSGIMLTKVFEEDGGRFYTFTVHHKKMNEMDMLERQNLIKELEQFRFVEKNCRFEFEFLGRE